MKALTVIPGRVGSARLEAVPDPTPEQGEVLVQTLAVGVCGTDIDILAGHYGTPAPGREHLILGHEALGRVLDAPPGCGLQPGDLVAGIVRRPDPVPCLNCAAGEWDMCRNGLFSERGIKSLDGFCSERFRIEPAFAVKLSLRLERTGALVEPASVVAKAWEHIDRIGSRAVWSPSRVLVTGAGPIGLLAALLGVQRGLEMHVLDRVTDGPKPELVRSLGATYHTSSIQEARPDADIIVECTGATALVIDAINYNAPNGIVCLTGVSSGERRQTIDVSTLNRTMVLQNDVVFGSVNANRRHFEAAVKALEQADQAWLEGLITRRVPLARWEEALVRQPFDVKPLIELAT